MQRRIWVLTKNKRVKMPKINKLLLLLILGAMVFLAANDFNRATQGRTTDGLNIMFYNVENFFDTLNSDLDDDEFLPVSPRRWNSYKYYRKLNNVFKVLVLCGNDMAPPDIIGLCEVENENVLKDLCEKTFLARDNYDYMISKGRDGRGINTALLFRKDRLSLLSVASWRPLADDGTRMITRAILYSRMKYRSDTLDVMVCHWPSRRGGAIESEGRRKLVASYLKEKVDSLGARRKVIIMGDFNDEPASASLHEVMRAVPPGVQEKNAVLINPGAGLNYSKGSYKYQGTWYLFDQVLLSPSLYRSESGLDYRKGSFRIVDNNALLTEDASFKGLRPYSTWWGYNYTGGFSDHLPVTVQLKYKYY